MIFFRKNIFLLLRIYIAFVVLFITALVLLACYTNYFNVHGDEVLYFNYGRMFFETGSLKTPFTVNEFSSSIGGFGWYGPFYNIIYGCVFKLLGAEHTAIITR